MAGHSIYDTLKDFQPALAAAIAFAAATLAYLAAMAKVRLDRRVGDQQRASERLGLLLRLNYQAERLQGSAIRKIRHIDEDLKSGVFKAIDGRQKWSSLYSFENEDFDEIETAWKSIQFLPVAAFEALDAVREQLRIIRQLGLKGPTVDKDALLAHKTICGLLERCVRSLTEALDQEIVRLRKGR